MIDFSNPAASALFHKIGSEEICPVDVQRQVDEVLKGGPDGLPTSFEKTVVVRVDEKEVFLLPQVIGMRDDAGAGARCGR